MRVGLTRRENGPGLPRVTVQTAQHRERGRVDDGHSRWCRRDDRRAVTAASPGETVQSRAQC